MSDFIKFLLTPLLTQPGALQIREASNSLDITVANEDMGRVIGKSGIIITALRNLVRIYCLTHSLPMVNFRLQENS